jgi:hypothetical protein
MEDKGKREQEKSAQASQTPKVPKKKRKTEPEITIAPTQPGGGTDISVG